VETSPPPPEEARLPVQAPRGVIDDLQRAVGLPLVVRGEPRHLIVADDEARVAHAQRPEDVLGQVGVEPLPGDDLDQVTEDVGGDRIVPAGARRELEGSSARVAIMSASV
jgi:hypothetical protein